MTRSKFLPSRFFVPMAAALALLVGGAAQAAPQERGDGPAYRHGKGKLKGNGARRGPGAHKGKHRARMLAKYDRNGDGQLGERERLAMKRDRFAALDANGDGSLTKKEMQLAIRNKRKEHKRLGKDGWKRGTARGGAKKGRGNSGWKSGKGKRSRGLENRFSRLDQNGDGVISRREFVKAKPGHRGHRKGHR